MPAFIISRTLAHPKPYVGVDTAIHRALEGNFAHTTEKLSDAIADPTVERKFSTRTGLVMLFGGL